MAKKSINKSQTSAQEVEHASTSELKSTNELLSAINDKLGKRISKRHEFILGVVRGLGAAIGATVVAAIALTIVNATINTVDDVPILRDFIQETNIQESIESEI